MRTKGVFLSLVLAIAGFGSAQASAQQDEDVRGAFLTTRPKAAAKSDKPARSRIRRRPPTPVPTPAPSHSSAKPIPQRMGLGLTLFMRDANGLAVRVDPSRSFSKGDHVRVLLETNSDGYLYVFNTTNDGPPVMIYPDPELEEAGNSIQGHVPWEIPASTAAEERLRWFTFDQNSGTERLFLVFTREPLAAVPIEDDLIKYCREHTGKCPWQPATDVWAQVKKELAEPVKTARTEGFGNSQTAAETQAATRGIGLNRSDPEPSLIVLTASTNRKILVATLALLHK